MDTFILFISLILLSLFLGVSTRTDEPLILTKYLQRGDIEGGQNASKVEPLVEGVESYSGYFTVDLKYNSNMFFWYFPSKDLNAPVVVWLQGGPGASSLFGLFYENGPLMIKNGKVVKREYTWTRVSHVIYIDNPVGTGFSFTNSSDGFVTNEEQVGNGLYSTLLQFFTLFPHLQKNDLYITGESYGGKYVPAAAYTIHINNPTAKLKLNLKGVAIGDGFSDPIHMGCYGDYLYQIGLIDESILDKFHTAETYIKNLIVEGKYEEANDATNILISAGQGSLMSNVTGITAYYNYYDPSDAGSDDEMEQLLQQDTVRRNIHVGNVPYGNSSDEVSNKLSADIMQTIVPWFKVIAENYRVIVYNGQLDIIVAYPLTVNFLRNFDWCGYKQYLKTTRKQWYVNDKLAGYTRTVKPQNCNGSLTEILVRNSGHMVPHDQPEWAFDIITKLVNSQDF